MLWLRKEQRFMTFREILESGAGRFLKTEQYEEINVDIIDNTPDEIAALSVETINRLHGTWQTAEEDEELQRLFWSLFKESDLNKTFKSRVGRDFLRKYRDLLK